MQNITLDRAYPALRAKLDCAAAVSTGNPHRERSMPHIDLSEPELGTVGWALQGLRGGPMPEEPRDPLTPDWGRTREQVWSALGAWGSPIAGDFEIAAIRRTNERGDILFECDLLSSAGKRSVMRCFVESSSPHRIRTFGVGRPLAEVYRARAATPCDAPALAAFEARVPIESDGSAISIDRGPHYWNHMKLMNSHVSIAEQEGEIVSAMASAFVPIMVDGEERTPCFLHHGRVHPDHQGQGLNRALAGRAMEYYMPLVQGDECSLFLIASTNSQALAPWPEDLRWSTKPQRLLFDVADLAGEPKGSIASPNDAARMVSLLNTCHGEEELFLPYSENRLSERLTRVPSAYSWPRLRIQDDALIGIGSAIEHRKHTRPDGSATETCRAPILDFGFTGENGWKCFEGLLRGACGELVDSEVTHLTLFTSPGSPGYSQLRALSSARETYVLITFDIEEPESLGGDGLYIDHLYF